MESIVGVIQPVLHGKKDGTTAYYFEMKDHEYVTLAFTSKEHVDAVPFNVRIALSVEDVPNPDGERVVSTDRPFFTRLDGDT